MVPHTHPLPQASDGMEKALSLQFNCGYAQVAVCEFTDEAREQNVNPTSFCKKSLVTCFPVLELQTLESQKDILHERKE